MVWRGIYIVIFSFIVKDKIEMRKGYKYSRGRSCTQRIMKFLQNTLMI